MVQDLKRQLNDLENDLRSARSRVQTCKQNLVRHKRESGELKISMQKKEDHAETLRDELDKENPEDGRLDNLRAALEEAEGDKQVNEGSYNDSVQAMNDMIQELKEIRREMTINDQKIKDLLEKSRVAGSEQSLVEGRRRELFDEKNAAEAKLEREKEDRAKLQERLDRAKARVVEYCEKAGMVSPRVAVNEGETATSLDHKLVKLNKDLERYTTQYVFLAACVVLH